VIASLPEAEPELLLVGKSRSLFEFRNESGQMARFTSALGDEVNVIGHYAIGVHFIRVARGATR
jgi:hypothetical protein